MKLVHVALRPEERGAAISLPQGDLNLTITSRWL
jgi:hypothetical protein